ncbi:hypothetical protein GCM10008022_44420 [Paenibacillus hunanensis]|nr:hypothetical protein GCM10008022_44420 [Paenibacillus hunanensis]
MAEPKSDRLLKWMEHSYGTKVDAFFYTALTKDGYTGYIRYIFASFDTVAGEG